MNELNTQDVGVKTILEIDDDLLSDQSLRATKNKLELFSQWMKYEIGEDSRLTDEEALEVENYLLRERKKESTPAPNTEELSQEESSSNWKRSHFSVNFLADLEKLPCTIRESLIKIWENDLANFVQEYLKGKTNTEN